MRSDSGVRIGADVSLGEMARAGEPVDTLTVVGGVGSFEAATDDDFLADVALLSRYPQGNTGRASAGLLEPMPVPDDLAQILEPPATD